MKEQTKGTLIAIAVIVVAIIISSLMYFRYEIMQYYQFHAINSLLK
jgi:uncharacterized membrane protein YkgB